MDTCCYCIHSTSRADLYHRVFPYTMAAEKEKFEELKHMYSGQELSECFASLHMTFDNDVQKIRNEVSKNYELMEVLHSNALLTNDDLQNIHNKIIPDLEDKISDEAKERIKIELRG